jgi:hypothetical protein
MIAAAAVKCVAKSKARIGAAIAAAPGALVSLVKSLCSMKMMQ